MKKLIFSIALLALVILSVTNVLAATLSITSIAASPSTAYADDNVSISYTINNTGASTINATAVLTISGLNLSYSSPVTILANNSTSSSFPTININSSMALGSYTASLTATDAANSSNNVSGSTLFSINYPYCSNRSADPIKIYDITNDDDITKEKYKPLDSFDIKVKVQNLETDTDEDDIDVVVSAVLVRDGEEVDDSVEEDLTIESKSKETATLTMTIPSDAEAGTYYVYVKATNDDDEDNCDQRVIGITVKKSTREIILSGLSVPANVSAGASIIIEGKMINIGNSDEDKVKLVYSDSFGGSSEIIEDNFDSGDDAPISFVLNVPRNATGKNTANFAVYYDYDEDDEEYDKKDTILSISFNVNGSQSVASQTITTEASTAITGTESEVTVTITNTGTALSTYSIAATADWAEIDSITPASASLASGESKEVIIKLTPKSGTEIGAHNLLVAVQHGDTSESKTVSVNVQQASSPSGIIDQLKFQLKYNPTWVIIDAVLVLAIIIVIIVLLSGKKA